MRRRYGTRVGMGAAAAASLAVAGALVPVGAMADTGDGASLETLFTETIEQNEDVEAVGRDASGGIVVVFATESDDATAATAAEDAAASLEGPLADEDVDIRTIHENGFDSLAEGNVVGGGGYLADDAGMCSMGFSGWSPEGDPAVITAGHCTDDGALEQVERTVPSGDPAGGGAEDNSDVVPFGDLGEFGFSQYGGPGNDPGDPQDPDPTYTDIAVIDVTNDDLTLLPEVTDWSEEAVDADDLSLSTTLVTSTGVVQGGEVAMSGRTTGHTAGQVDIVDGYALIGGRVVHGFSAELGAAPGDSGGAIIQGETAVGILSGGDPAGDATWGAHVESALEMTPGYTVALHVEAPELTSPSDGGTVGAGDALSGTGPAGATLVVTPADGEEFDVDIDGDGNWSFPAPEEVGDFEFTISAARGFDESAQNTYTVEVLPQAPSITSPEDGEEFTNELTEISGTGQAGATLELTGDVTSEVEIGADGEWSAEADLGPGAYSLTATQTIDGVQSAEASVDFSVVPEVPGITSPGDGESYAHDDAPAGASGTGIAGAEIAVMVGDEMFEGTVDEDGQWAVEFDEPLEPGEHTLEVIQTINGMESAEASVDFAVVPAAPQITSPGDGESFPSDAAPTGASGTGIPGAEIAVMVGDETFEVTVDEDGQWAVEFDEALEAGEYTLEATQTVNDMTSEAASASFVVESTPTVPEDPEDELPETGLSGASGPLVGLAGLSMLAGVGLVLAARRAGSLA